MKLLKNISLFVLSLMLLGSSAFAGCDCGGDSKILLSSDHHDEDEHGHGDHH